MSEIMTRLGKQPGEPIEYDDAETLRALLTGQQIIGITETTSEEIHKREGNPVAWYETGRGEYDRVIEYHLASGVILRAHAQDGGCGCDNGCFTVELAAEARQKLIGATIMNISIEERATADWGDSAERLIIDGRGEKVSDGSSTIQVFAYLPGLDERTVLVQSSGGDNGYYGWGFHFTIVHPVLVVQEQISGHTNGAER